MRQHSSEDLIKIIYVVGVALLILGWLGFTLSAFATGGPFSGLLTLVVGAVVAVL